MRILAITFAFALVGCVDDGVTPVGVDDIEENTDDFGPDIHKGDVDGPTTERPTGPDFVPDDLVIPEPQGDDIVKLNPVPVRSNTRR